MQMRGRTSGRCTMLLTIVLAALSLCGCGSDTNLTSDRTRPTPMPTPTPRTAFERDLQYIKEGGWAHVYVIARKDGEALDREDAAHLRANAPKAGDTVITDEGRRAISGTNFDFTPENIEALRKRFSVENYTGR